MLTEIPPFNDLTDEQKSRLTQLEHSITNEAITVSFSLDGRDAQDRKKSAFVSIRGVRHDGPPGWSKDDAQVVVCMLSKQVVAATYRDAVVRGFIQSTVAKEDVPAILNRYDRAIAAILKRGTESDDS